MAIETITVKDAADATKGVLADKIGAGEEYAQVLKQAYGADGTLTLMDEKPATAANQATTNAALGAPADAEATGDGTITAILKRIRTRIDAIVAAVTGTLTVGGTVAVSNLPGTQPVSGTVAVSNLPGTQAVSGPLTDTELRAAAVPISGALTDAQLRATPVPVSGSFSVSGGLTDAELRATPVPVSGTVAVTGTFWQATQPVSATSLPLPAGAATEATSAALNAKLPALIATVPPNNASAPPVRMVGQDVWACSFAAVGASVLSPEFTTPIVGTGVTYNQGAGALNILTGTNTNAEFLTRSVQSWRGSLRMRASLVASQRIVNQNLQITLADLIGEGLAYSIVSATVVDVTLTAHGYTAQNVGQSMNLGGITGAAGVPGRYAIASIPNANTIRFTVAGWPGSGSGTLTLFGWNYVRNLFTGATAAAMNWDAQRRGWASGDTTPTSITTASPGLIFQNDLNGRDAFLANQLRASAAAPNFTTLASRYENIPDDDVVLYVFIWNYNGTVAPASTTTWTIGFVSVEKFANTPVYIQGQRAQGTQNAGPVSLVGALPAGANIIGALTANQTVNVAQIGGNAVISALGQGGGNRALGVLFASPVTNAAAEVVSAARVSSGNSGALAVDFGNVMAAQIIAAGGTGTNPTLDLVLEESWDNGSTWHAIYQFPQITTAAPAAGLLTMPPMLISGRRRWTWTIGGTTPSFTFSVVTMFSSAPAPILRRLVDYTIAPNSAGSTSGTVVQMAGCKNFSLFVTSGAGATVNPVYGIRYRVGYGVAATEYADSGLSLTAPPSSSVTASVSLPALAQDVRPYIKTAGTGAVQNMCVLYGSS